MKNQKQNLKKHNQRVDIQQSYHIPTTYLTIATRATGTAIPHFFLTTTQIKTGSARYFGSTHHSVWMWKTILGKPSYNLLINTSPVLVRYIKYLTVILSRLVAVVHQISNKLSKDTTKNWHREKNKKSW